MSYIKGKSFKIVSKFYVIYGDDEPIYVGYTNRTVKQRFREHKKDKDFSDYEKVEVKELVDEKLSFDFTWDYEQTCRNADEVSLREGQLVQKYGTQDSVFQKADGGGQTWATEKWFVKSNKDNPKFIGLPGVEIKRLIKEEKAISVWIHNFVNHMEPVEETWLHNSINNMAPTEEQWLSSFVKGMKLSEKVWLSNFINNMQPVEEKWLVGFVKNVKPIEEVWLSSFVSTMNQIEETWLRNFVTHMRPIEKQWLSSFVGNMKPIEEIWLGHFIGHMAPPEEIWLNSFVSSMKLKNKKQKIKKS